MRAKCRPRADLCKPGRLQTCDTADSKSALPKQGRRQVRQVFSRCVAISNCYTQPPPALYNSCKTQANTDRSPGPFHSAAALPYANTPGTFVPFSANNSC